MRLHRFRLARIIFLAIMGGMVLLSLAFTMTDEDRAMFQLANQAYRSGDYQEASKQYQELLSQHPDDATLLYNLGNAEFRNEKMGKAILNYERALLVSPRHSDARHNLDYARSLIEYRIEDKRNWYLRNGEKVLEYFSEREVMVVTLLAYFILMVWLSGVLFYHKGLTWDWRIKAFVVLFCLSAMLFVGKHVETRVIRDAIVTSKSANVRYGPSESDQVAFRLTEGLKVYVIDRRDDWSRIILVNGESGWVQNTDITKVMA